MKNKSLRVFAGMVAMCLCLYGCGKEVLESPEAESPDATSLSSMETPVTVDGMEIRSQDSYHIDQEVLDNLVIHAEATIPNKQQYSAYALEMVDCEPDRLFKIFSPNGYEDFTVEDLRKDHGYVIYHEVTGKELVVYENSIRYRTYNYSMDERSMQDVESLMYYYIQERPNASPHDLPFMTVQEMKEFGENVFAQLGLVWDPTLLTCVTLSGQEILEFQDDLFSNGVLVQSDTSTALTEATDTCCMQFNFAYDGIHLIGREEPTISTYATWDSSPSVTASLLLNADGIQSCYVSFPCTVEQILEPQTIIDIEGAIACLKSKFDLEIIPEPRTITKVYMEYIPVKKDGTMILTPYWCFEEVDESLIEQPGYQGNATRFNAFTGGDLAYGG